MKALLIAPLVGAAVLLAGCAGAVPGNPQGFAGINKGTIRFVDGSPSLIEVWGGKEQSSVELSGTLPDGTAFTYSATDTKAFDGVKARAAVEAAVAAEVGDTLPGLVDAIMDALLGL